MPRFRFRSDPAWVTVGEGLSLGFRHWTATATSWAIPVLLVGVISTVAYWGLEATMRTRVLTFVDPYDPMPVGPDVGATFGPLLPGFVVSTLILGTVSIVTRWVYYALAVKGLRGGEISAAWLIARGVRAFAVDMLIMLGAAGVMGVLFLVATSGGVGLAILTGIVAFVVLTYVEVRLVFWPLAIFDGAGILEALAGSWQASEGAMLRMIGWALAAGAVGFVVNIGASIVTLPLSGAVPLQSGVRAGATEAFVVFELFVLAVLYESQLRRNLPERASPPPAPEPSLDRLRPWPGYVPADPGGAAPDGPAWPGSQPVPGPGAASGQGQGPWQGWDEPPINPDAPDRWDTEPRDPAAPDAPTDPPQPPKPPA